MTIILNILLAKKDLFGCHKNFTYFLLQTYQCIKQKIPKTWLFRRTAKLGGQITVTCRFQGKNVLVAVSKTAVIGTSFPFYQIDWVYNKHLSGNTLWVRSFESKAPAKIPCCGWPRSYAHPSTSNIRFTMELTNFRSSDLWTTQNATKIQRSLNIPNGKICGNEGSNSEALLKPKCSLHLPIFNVHTVDSLPLLELSKFLMYMPAVSPKGSYKIPILLTLFVDQTQSSSLASPITC